ncbi:hypothetical protein [Cohnella mopanensis]|uniref:hypothetical protein n=1 Tax=Cohnella mopanensis TaxID=2911966 RepID=UPI001EF8474C|nr:hypothetical protein [Cohnella mopanensis]
MLKYFFILLIILLSGVVFLVINNKGHNPEREQVTVSYLNNPVQIDDLGIEVNSNTLSSWVMEQRYKQDRYVFITGYQNNEITRFLFDTNDEKLNIAKHANNTRFKVVNNNDGNIEVYNLINNKLIYSFKNENYIVNFSSTERYLVATSNKKTLLIDLDKEVELPTPISGRTYYSWSPNDKKAILEKYDDYPGDGKQNEYLWNLQSSTVSEFKSRPKETINWGFNGDFIYSYSNAIDKDIIFRIYDTNKNQWKDIYSTDLQLEETAAGNIRWISSDEFLYVGSKSSFSIFNLLAMAAKQDFYAVKVNWKKQSDKRIKLKAFSARYSVWSFDNNYIYYIDRHNEDDKGFYKMEVNFSK